MKKIHTLVYGGRKALHMIFTSSVGPYAKEFFIMQMANIHALCQQANKQLLILTVLTDPTLSRVYKQVCAWMAIICRASFNRFAAPVVMNKRSSSRLPDDFQNRVS